MIKIYTDDEARRDLGALLDDAERGGDVRIQRHNGREFVVRPAEPGDILLEDYAQRWKDLPVIDLGVTTEEIVAAVREGRERHYEWMDRMTREERAGEREAQE